MYDAMYPQRIYGPSTSGALSPGAIRARRYRAHQKRGTPIHPAIFTTARRGRGIDERPRGAQPKKGKEMIIEKGLPRCSRIVGARGPNPRRLRLTKEMLANIAALVALTMMPGTVTAEQTTKTIAVIAINQFDECSGSLFTVEFGSAEVDYDLSLNKEAVLFLSAECRSHDGTISVLTSVRSIGNTVIRTMIMTQSGK